MKKWIVAALATAGLLGLAGCGSDGEKQAASADGAKVLTVGASNVPHAKILEQVKPILKDKGIELKIETYDDYVLPNKDLESKDLDANYFQHEPYLKSQIADNGYEFESAGSIHIEPIGIYSKKYKKLSELPGGASILMSNSVADHGRLLSLLEDNKLITLKPDVDRTKAELKDIVDNPKHLKFEPDFDAAYLVQLYKQDEGDALLINSNYAIDAGLRPLQDAIAIESSDSPYANVVAVRKGDAGRAEIKELVAALKSKPIQDYILKEWNGSVVPVK